MSKNVEVLKALDRAIKLAGSQSELARLVEYTQNGIWKAKSTGRVSAQLAVRIEAATGGKVRKERLAPQVFCKLPKHLAGYNGGEEEAA